jgi:bifunctional UDP-N-acetylglucosamine pyrophosphorylase/glucosamine-1-phosphate N-acetyltransferase
MEIRSGIHWVGVLDPDLEIFDIVIPTEWGTTYNSYLIEADEPALVDTVKANFTREFLTKLEEKIDLADFDGPVLVTYGDTPLFRGETFQELLNYHLEEQAAATVVTAYFPDPSGYGRVVRGKNRDVLKIVEHKDASEEELKIQEINTGTYCFNSKLLFKYLKQITPDNAQSEYYLPDVIPLLIQDGYKVAGYVLDDPQESMGINDRIQLSQAERIMRERICRYWMEQGVTLIDPDTTFIEVDCTIGPDTVIYPQTLIQQGTTIGEKCIIGPNCRLAQARIGAEVTMENAVVVGCSVGDKVEIDPFTYLTK